jgi:N-acetyl-anhydromuramyl-L-alanine amidase AmpD
MGSAIKIGQTLKEVLLAFTLLKKITYGRLEIMKILIKYFRNIPEFITQNRYDVAIYFLFPALACLLLQCVIKLDTHKTEGTQGEYNSFASIQNSQSRDFRGKSRIINTNKVEIDNDSHYSPLNNLLSSVQNPSFSTPTNVPNFNIIEKLADHSNFGARLTKDINNKNLNNDLLVVLHETVIPANKTIEKFQANHPRDEDQASYHALITLNGTIIVIVPKTERAYGAGNSKFYFSKNFESVQTNASISPSVNNFAYHIGLETPPISEKNNMHSFQYTKEQYKALAFLLYLQAADNFMPLKSVSRITTHKYIDMSGTRSDPRNFDSDRLTHELELYKNPLEKLGKTNFFS